MAALNTTLKMIAKGINSIGKPVQLIKLLVEYPEARVCLDRHNKSISSESVVHWHELGDSYSRLGHSRYQRGTLLGWKYTSNRYSSFELYIPEFTQIGRREVLENWSCDIADVYGFFASKAELRSFTSTDAMAETRCRNLIDEITPEKLANNLAHKGIRIIHRPDDVDYFALHQWDGRLFLMNNDGSHHFASAKYIAARLDQAVPLSGKLYTYSLNEAAISLLRRDYEMFVIPKEPTFFMGFSDAMEAYRATWLGHDMPRPYEDTKAVLFPKNEKRSMRVARALRAAGVTDLGGHLSDLLAKQIKYRSNNSSMQVLR